MMRFSGGFRKEIGLWALLLLAANFTLRAIIAIRPLRYIDNLTLPDDTYLSLTIARNIARGLGPLYGEYFTNGFQPLYVFLVAPFFKIWPHDYYAPVHASLLLLTVFDTIALFFFLKIIDEWQCDRRIFIGGGLLWVFNSYGIYTTLNGLETVLSVACILAALWCFQNFFLLKKLFQPKYYAIFGAALGLSVFARIDSTIFAAAVSILLLLLIFKRAGIAEVLKAAIIISGSALIIIGPWLIYSYMYTGTIYPVSGRAVRFMSLSGVQQNATLENTYFPMVKAATFMIVRKNIHFILGSILAGVLLFRNFKREKRDENTRLQVWTVGALALFSVMLFTAYSLYIFAPWFFSRYLYPIAVFLLFLLIALLDRLIRYEKKSPKLILMLGFAILLFEIAHPGLKKLLFSKPYEDGYMNIGLWARKNFKQGTVIGGSQTGALGYFADNLKVVNLDGVVSKTCFEYIRRDRTMDFVRMANIEYIINWSVNHQFLIENSAGFKETDVTQLYKIHGFQSWRSEWFVYKVNY